jgi:uncharacterized protein YndB with AHSA1/START domain
MKPTTESILIECDLPQPPEKVWRALTKPELLGKWLMSSDLRAQVGARFHFRPDSSTEGGNTPIDCEVLDVEPQRRLRWVQREQGGSQTGCPWVESVVTLELVGSANGGTRLRLVHDGFTSISREGAPELLSPKASAAVVEFKPRKLTIRKLNGHSRHRRTVTTSLAVTLLRRAA